MPILFLPPFSVEVNTSRSKFFLVRVGRRGSILKSKRLRVDGEDGSQHFKERVCSSRRIFFPLRVDPILDGLSHLGKQTGSHH